MAQFTLRWAFVSAALAVTCCTAGAAAQGGSGGGGGVLMVPISECDRSLPHDYDEHCSAAQAWCQRVDSVPVVVFAGTTITVGAFNTCHNCNWENDPGCPENPPSGVLNCSLSSKLSRSQTATATIDTRVTAGIPGVEASIGSSPGTAIGVVVEVSSSCSYSVEPCKEARIYGSLIGTFNKSVEMDHTWTTGGTWVSVGGLVPSPEVHGTSHAVPPPRLGRRHSGAKVHAR